MNQTRIKGESQPTPTGPNLALRVNVVQDADGNWGVQFDFSLAMVGAGIGLAPENARALGQALIKAGDEARAKLITPPTTIV
jgi:hypothetical protein